MSQESCSTPNQSSSLHFLLCSSVTFRGRIQMRLIISRSEMATLNGYFLGLRRRLSSDVISR
jgi:hypothetical protein